MFNAGSFTAVSNNEKITTPERRNFSKIVVEELF